VRGVSRSGVGGCGTTIISEELSDVINGPWKTGEYAGDAVGDTVGDAVGDTVGDAVDDTIGELVGVVVTGEDVGSLVGVTSGMQVPHARRQFFPALVLSTPFFLQRVDG